MGILSSLFTGVSGLNASVLSVVGNNIANLSTVGFKSSRSVFADLISSSLGGAIQTGLGVALNGVQGNFSEGSLSTSSNALDLAIDGNGFVILRDALGGTVYSRAGQYHLDSQNCIVDPSGVVPPGGPPIRASIDCGLRSRPCAGGYLVADQDDRIDASRYPAVALARGASRTADQRRRTGQSRNTLSGEGAGAGQGRV